MQKKLQYYQTRSGSEPARDWLYHGNLDKDTIGIIHVRLERLKLGNPGHWRSVGRGVYELKIDHGPGYRVYYGNIGKDIILLLCGGAKRSQKKDIITAQEYWADYKKHIK